MELFVAVWAVVGALVGSFLNVVIVRLATNESVVRGRSHCRSCKRTLSAFELIPIVSFVFLRGRCRSCGVPIGARYPIVEAVTALLFGFVAFRFWSADFGSVEAILMVFVLSFVAGLVVIFAYDMHHYLIPDKVLVPLIFLALIYQLALGFGGSLSGGLILSPLLGAFGAALAGGLFFLVLFLISKGEWMGFGDVKLVVFMGLLLGLPGLLLALFFAFVSGAIIGIALMAWGRKNLGDHVPFAPFLICGIFVSFFWGPPIIAWYLRFVLA